MVGLEQSKDRKEKGRKGKEKRWGQNGEKLRVEWGKRKGGIEEGVKERRGERGDRL